MGHAVGALCVMDDRPARFAPDILAQLRKLPTGRSEWLGERHRASGALERTREQLRLVTFTDTTTGLPSRLVLQDRILQAGARSDRTGQTLAVFYVRLHGASPLGKHGRDPLEPRALREVGSRFAGVGRATDTVARLGECDFVILAEGCGNVDAAVQLAQSVHSALVPPVRSSTREVELVASIGVALYPSDGPPDRLVAHAAMACEPERPTSGCSFFQRAMAEAEHVRAERLDGLRHAQERGQFALHYQPKIDARSGAVTGVEALLRWQHPTLGDVSPADFIPARRAVRAHRRHRPLGHGRGLRANARLARGRAAGGAWRSTSRRSSFARAGSSTTSSRGSRSRASNLRW